MKYNIQTTTVQYIKHSDGTEVFFRGKFSPEANIPLGEELETLISEGKAELIEREEEAFVEEIIGHVVPKNQYKIVRKYPAIGEQLDMLWHDINTGKLGENAKESDWYNAILAVKTAHPKS